MKQNMLFGIMTLTAFIVFGQEEKQDCSCHDNYTWLKETFEQNDAGFYLVKEQNREADYKKHNEHFEKKVKFTANKDECFEILTDWLKFFRTGHLYLSQISNPNQQAQPVLTNPEEIRKHFKDWETYPYNEQEFNTHISNLKEPTLEGIWSNPPYKIGVKKVNNEYLGFIIEADGIYWTKSQVKFKIKETKGKFTGTFYMRDHRGENIPKVELLGKNYLKMGAISLKRLQPTFKEDPDTERYIKYNTSRATFYEELTDNTGLLRIPTFAINEKVRVDSIIKANWGKIMSKENLIIDIRNNDGGFNETYEKVIELLYTNPIRTMGIEFLSTKLNNQRMHYFMNNLPNLSEDRKQSMQKSYEILEQNLGKFVNLSESDFSIKELDTIYEYPKKVGIIIHERNLSSAEEFLLAAKQSTKVKLFGKPTMGVQDISNMYFTESPCNNIMLRYSLTRSLRMPDMAIDGKGIQPDYFIDDSISEYNWIDFVIKILNGKV